MSEDLLQPGLNISPKINVPEIKNLLKKLYGFNCAKISELNGYDDKNYKVTVSAEHTTNAAKDGYVLKILNSLDSKKIEFIEGQNELLLFLGNNGIECPKPVKNVNGQYYSLEKLETGDHVVRLMIYLPGEILHKVVSSPQLFYQAGQYIAKIDLTLKKFHHPAYETHKTLWMLDATPMLRQFLFSITNLGRKSMIEEIINQFETQVLSHKNQLLQGMIHGDFNEQNIVVNCVDNEWRITSILDFGDSHRSCYLYELAITMTYMMIVGKDVNIGGYVLAGYTDVLKMDDFEISLLKICIMARLCQSLVLGAYSAFQNPENATYLLTTSKPGWELLHTLFEDTEGIVLGKWKMTSQKYNR